MNSLTEPLFLSLRHDMEYLMNSPHEPIMYSIESILTLNHSPHQCFLNVGSAYINKTH